ncbi:hypothetical protein C4E15_28125 [Achromobacter spanius]|uniref:Uncharacterized protein n=1 Tax=Achromobacter spanius TaxID=217203 RepID=A0A2S5GIT2_9BURK|nr:hypothetical protein [Achromobacter spanius]PPA72834.1 hypothetical protein C4E15_28125 [Achromobacter spanius]
MNTEWKLVPVEPTDEMEVAAENDYEQTGATFPRWKSAYAAMLKAAPPAPTSHPIPTGATGERDWELSCDECNGSGHVFVKHQVAERKTDVQEFKEECEGCEGRGFNIAFEDIPGIAEYVKSCRPASTVADEGAKDEQEAFEAWAKTQADTWLIIGGLQWSPGTNDYASTRTNAAWEAWKARGRTVAPAAGDALAVEDHQHLNWMIAEECRIETLALGNGTRYRVHWPDVDEHQAEWFFSPGGAIRAAIAQQKGEA